MILSANFTRHYPRFQEIVYWRAQGCVLDATPRLPSLDPSWKEAEIVKALREELKKARSQDFTAIMIGGLSNMMAYTWYIATSLGMDVYHARGRRQDEGFVVSNHTKLLAPGQVAKAA